MLGERVAVGVNAHGDALEGGHLQVGVERELAGRVLVSVEVDGGQKCCWADLRVQDEVDHRRWKCLEATPTDSGETNGGHRSNTNPTARAVVRTRVATAMRREKSMLLGRLGASSLEGPQWWCFPGVKETTRDKQTSKLAMFCLLTWLGWVGTASAPYSGG